MIDGIDAKLQAKLLCFRGYYVEKGIPIKRNGYVLIALHEPSQSRRCLKVIDGTSGESYLEPSLAYKLQNSGGHANVVNLIENFSIETWFVSVWELWDGDLFDRLNDCFVHGHPLSDVEKKNWFLQILLGVQYLHEHKIAHLDLALENILVKSMDNAIPRVAVCDFDLSLHLPNSTMLREPRGRSAYLTPEAHFKQVYNGLKADVYSLGVILFVLLTNKFPFKIESKESTKHYYFVISSTRKLQNFLEENNLSEPAVDLLSKMLCPELRRISLSEVIQHSFLQPSLMAIHDGKSGKRSRNEITPHSIPRRSIPRRSVSNAGTAAPADGAATLDFAHNDAESSN